MLCLGEALLCLVFFVGLVLARVSWFTGAGIGTGFGMDDAKWLEHVFLDSPRVHASSSTWTKQVLSM